MCSTFTPNTLLAMINLHPSDGSDATGCAKGFVLPDRDGSMTGTPGGWIVADTPFLLPDPSESMTCGPVSAGNVRMCSFGYSGYILIAVDDSTYVTTH